MALVLGSVTDADLVDALIDECDCCLHLASAVGVKLVVSSRSRRSAGSSTAATW